MAEPFGLLNLSLALGHLWLHLGFSSVKQSQVHCEHRCTVKPEELAHLSTHVTSPFEPLGQSWSWSRTPRRNALGRKVTGRCRLCDKLREGTLLDPGA